MSGATYWLAPTGQAIVQVGSAGIEIRRVDGTTITASGALADEVLAYIDTAERGPRLGCLAEVSPYAEGLAGLAGIGRIPLTPTHALGLAAWDLLFIELTGRCNERCVHCYADSSPDVDTALSRETVLSILDDAKAIGFERVQFTGGDPLLCTFLPELVDRAAQLGLRPEIYTNGLLLTEKLVARLAPNRPVFAFSYYSLRPEIHDAITRTPNSHALTTRAIERALGAGLYVRTSIIVMEQNAPDIRATVDHLRAMGVEQIDLAPGRSVGRGSAFHGDLDADLWSVGRSAHGGDSARRSMGKLAVASTGSVYPCIFNRDTRLGDVSRRSLREIVAQPELRRSLVASSSDEADAEKLQCSGCRLTASALRACVRGVAS